MEKLVKFWSLPVRLHHWIHVLLLFVLIVTGMYIYYPFLASSEVSMATVRLVHYVAMFLFLADLAIRFYMAIFSPNLTSTWRVWLVSQRIAYLGWFFLILAQGFTGLIIYFAPYNETWAGFGDTLGGITMVRLLHIAIMWTFILSVLGHIYIAMWHSMRDRSRSMRSMFSGYKPEAELQKHLK